MKHHIEYKKGYNEIDLISLFDKKNNRDKKQIDKWLAEVSKNAVDASPVLVWKKRRKPELAFRKIADYTITEDIYLLYHDWVVVLWKPQ